MMFTDTEKIDANPVGKNRLGNDVADDLRLGQEDAVWPGRHIAEGIESKFKMLWHWFSTSGHGRGHRDGISHTR